MTQVACLEPEHLPFADLAARGWDLRPWDPDVEPLFIQEVNVLVAGPDAEAALSAGITARARNPAIQIVAWLPRGASNDALCRLAAGGARALLVGEEAEASRLTERIREADDFALGLRRVLLRQGCQLEGPGEGTRMRMAVGATCDRGGRPDLRLGEFLLERGLVEPRTVLKALVDQDKQQIHPLDFLHHQAGLSAEVCMTLSREAERRRECPTCLALERGLLPRWTEEAVRQALRGTRPALGRLLVRMGAADPTAMREWIFGFLGVRNGLESQPAITPVPEPLPVQRQEAAQPAPAPAAPVHADVDLPETAPIEVEDNLIEDYHQFLDEELHLDLENRILAIRQASGEDLISRLDHLYRDFHSLKGTANFIGAKATVAIIHASEDSLGLAKLARDALDEGTRQDLIDCLLRGVDMVWDLRRSIVAERDESARLAAIADLYRAFRRDLTATLVRIGACADAAAANLEDQF